MNTMNCSDNNKRHIPDVILPETEQLIMTGNNLGILAAVNENLSQVKMFDFQKSNISSVHEKALKVLLRNATGLNLSGNKITRLPLFFKNDVAAAHLWLGHNPYECNCEMMWMTNWLRNATNVVDKENITCGVGTWEGEQVIKNATEAPKNNVQVEDCFFFFYGTTGSFSPS